MPACCSRSRMHALLPVAPALSKCTPSGSPHTPLRASPVPLLPPSPPQVSRGAEDLKDKASDAGNKIKGDSKGAGDDLSKKADRTGKDLQNKAEDAADDSEGMLKQVSV